MGVRVRFLEVFMLYYWYSLMETTALCIKEQLYTQ